MDGTNPEIRLIILIILTIIFSPIISTLTNIPIYVFYILLLTIPIPILRSKYITKKDHQKMMSIINQKSINIPPEGIRFFYKSQPPERFNHRTIYFCNDFFEIISLFNKKYHYEDLDFVNFCFRKFKNKIHLNFKNKSTFKIRCSKDTATKVIQIFKSKQVRIKEI